MYAKCTHIHPKWVWIVGRSNSFYKTTQRTRVVPGRQLLSRNGKAAGIRVRGLLPGRTSGGGDATKVVKKWLWDKISW